MRGKIFSGIQPTGDLHIGNYLGAIKNWVSLQSDFDCIYCVVDLHAITVPRPPSVLINDIREVVAGLVASGINPKKSILFNQSSVSQHAELAWIFNCVARLGWLNRMTQFKEKAGKDKDNATVGLYVYPTLMAADILLYKATHVPVGDDQKQHLELTRDIAMSFNSTFNVDFFPLPEPQIFGAATRVMSLRDGLKKMSKSEPSEFSRITLKDDSNSISQKIRKAKTDTFPIPEDFKDLEKRPEAKNLIGIYAALANKEINQVLNEFSGKGFAEFKPKLSDLAISILEPINTEMQILLKNIDYIDQILKEGSEKASLVAKNVLIDTKKIMGFI